LSVSVRFFVRRSVSWNEWHNTQQLPHVHCSAVLTHAEGTITVAAGPKRYFQPTGMVGMACLLQQCTTQQRGCTTALTQHLHDYRHTITVQPIKDAQPGMNGWLDRLLSMQLIAAAAPAVAPTQQTVYMITARYNQRCTTGMNGWHGSAYSASHAAAHRCSTTARSRSGT
jgi:hypothetical protein